MRSFLSAASKLIFAMAASILLVSTQGGCTYSLWEGANRETRNFSGIPGVVRSTSNTHPQFVLLYDGADVSESHVLLPIDSSGSPPSPFVYAGKHRTVREISADLSPAQIKAIEKFVFDEESKSDAKQAMKSPAYSPHESSNDQRETTWPVDWYYSDRTDIIIVAVGPDEMPRKAKEVKLRDQSDYLFPDDCRILILPGHQPRTPAEMKESFAVAIALTPLTVATDAVLIPVAFILRIAMGGC